MQKTREQLVRENLAKLAIMPDVEIIVALYGVPSDDGEVLSEQEAMQLFETLKQQETILTLKTGYYLSNVRIEGDRERGVIRATAKWEA